MGLELALMLGLELALILGLELAPNIRPETCLQHQT